MNDVLHLFFCSNKRKLYLLSVCLYGVNSRAHFSGAHYPSVLAVIILSISISHKYFNECDTNMIARVSPSHSFKTT